MNTRILNLAAALHCLPALALAQPPLPTVPPSRPGRLASVPAMPATVATQPASSPASTVGLAQPASGAAAPLLVPHTKAPEPKAPKPAVPDASAAATAKGSDGAAPAHPEAAAPINIESAGYERWTAWFDARKAAAKAGHGELIRLPVALRGQGWGCQCPSAYVGASANEAVPGPWLSLNFKNLDGPEAGVEGATFLAEGRLTGATEQEDLRNEDGEPEEWLYTLQVFEVERFAATDFDGDAIARVVLTAAELAEVVVPFADGRSKLVVVARFDRRQADALAKADAEVVRLKAAGFSEAEHFDSRRSPRLFAGQEVVVVGRTADSASAKALLARAKQAGLKPKVYSGF